MLENMRATIGTYNDEVARFAREAPNFESTKARDGFVDSFVIGDPAKISWSSSLKAALGRRQEAVFDQRRATASINRPYNKQWLYFDRLLNHRVGQMPRLFPDEAVKNQVICVSAKGGKVPFSALMTDAVPMLHMVDIDGSQCFPRYLYDPVRSGDDAGLFDKSGGGACVRRDAITDEGLGYFRAAYPGEKIGKDDLFHFVYGLLHSSDYRERYADNLSRQLPRLPLPKRVEDFRAFVAAGRALGELHVGFETVEPYPVTIREGDLRLANIGDPVSYYRVEQMKFAGKRPNLDRTTVIYNPRITITGIPLEAYGYVVNGKPALEWVMERQAVRTDAASGIVNDANRYAVETAGDPAYPFRLFRRVITVSLETQKVVKGLPALDIREPLQQ